MSVRVMQAVWQHSQQSGGALVLLLAIADNAHDDGDGAYPSNNTLAQKARMTGRNVNMLIKKLEEDGEIAIRHGAGPNGVNVYRVLLPGLSTPENISPLKTFHPEKKNTGGVKKSAGGGEKSGTQGVKRTSPKPSLNHQRKPSVKPSLPSEQFDRFWSVYPKRKKRAEAEAWFAKHQPDADLVDTMIAAVERACGSQDWHKEDGRFIPLPATWLNGKRWQDEEDIDLPRQAGGGRLVLVGKDQTRMDVAERAIARAEGRKHGYSVVDDAPDADSSYVPSRVVGLGNGRVSR